VHGAELALLVRPLIPDADAMLVQPGGVRIVTQEPEQLADYRANVNLLRRDEREALREIEAHLATEERERAGASAIGLACAGVSHLAHHVQIGFHRRASLIATARGCRSALRADRRRPSVRCRRESSAATGAAPS